MKLKRVLTACLAMVASTLALSWDGVAQGKIQTLEITDSSNYGFRVALNPNVQMCTGGPSFAFLFEGDSNYKVYVAALLAAKVAGNNVAIFSIYTSGNCHIGHVVIAP